MDLSLGPIGSSVPFSSKSGEGCDSQYLPFGEGVLELNLPQFESLYKHPATKAIISDKTLLLFHLKYLCRKSRGITRSVSPFDLCCRILGSRELLLYLGHFLGGECLIYASVCNRLGFVIDELPSLISRC